MPSELRIDIVVPAPDGEFDRGALLMRLRPIVEKFQADCGPGTTVDVAVVKARGPRMPAKPAVSDDELPLRSPVAVVEPAPAPEAAAIVTIGDAADALDAGADPDAVLAAASAGEPVPEWAEKLARPPAVAETKPLPPWQRAAGGA